MDGHLYKEWMERAVVRSLCSSGGSGYELKVRDTILSSF